MMKNRESSHQVLDSVLGYYMWVFWGNNLNLFSSEFSSKKLLNFQLIYVNYAFQVSQFGVFHRAVKKYRAAYHQHNSES